MVQLFVVPAYFNSLTVDTEASLMPVHCSRVHRGWKRLLQMLYETITPNRPLENKYSRHAIILSDAV